MSLLVAVAAVVVVVVEARLLGLACGAVRSGSLLVDRPCCQDSSSRDSRCSGLASLQIRSRRLRCCLCQRLRQR